MLMISIGIVELKNTLYRPVVVNYLNHRNYHLDYLLIHTESLSAMYKKCMNPIMQHAKCDGSACSATCFDNAK